MARQRTIPLIARELYFALERFGAGPDLLAIIGSWRDTVTDVEILAYLRQYNSTGRAMRPVLANDERNAPMIDEHAVAKRLRTVRTMLGFDGHGGQTALCTKYGLDPKRWSAWERGEIAFQVDGAVLLIEHVVPGLTLDWLYFGKTEGLPFRLLNDLSAAELSTTSA